MNTIIDTQVLSYCFKGFGYDIHDRNLAITANEFLLAQPRETYYPDYYIIHPARSSRLLQYLLQSEGNSFSISDRLGNPKRGGRVRKA